MPSGPVERLELRAPRFFAGESITWKVTFAGIEGGRARLAVGAPGVVEGRNVVMVSAQARTSGLFAAIKRLEDDITSWVDAATGAPVRTESETNLDGKRRITHASFSETHATMRTWAPASRAEGAPMRESNRRLPLRQTTHDAMSSLLMIRGWDAADGARGRFFTLGGRQLWSTVLSVEAREEIDGPLGLRRCIRIGGVSTRVDARGVPQPGKKQRTFVVWLSDDERRVPVRIVATTEYGDVVASAESYDPGPATR